MTNKIHRYTSEAIDVTFDPKRCIHAAECVRGLPAVFDRNKRPWAQPGNAGADDVSMVVVRCPTGALHFERNDGGEAEPIAGENTITLVKDGPLFVRGNVEIWTASGETVSVETRLALCRCGASANKPFCDNSHLRIEFQDAGGLSANRVVAGEQESLTVTPLRNGPLLLRGSFELLSADRHTNYQGTKAELCRCGGSRNKPFCDGTHRRIGFTDADEGVAANAQPLELPN
ncbi:MAG: CDGSH iron-sulfur domain-containing protein [Chloroflexi bacterium]|nr:CDGSH iron-sulfur domain-containing protein [Chloroflexota bacterium]